MKNTNEFVRKYRIVYARIYFDILLIMVSLIVVCFFYLRDDEVDYGLGTYEWINDQWTDREGNPFTISEIDSYADEREEVITIFYTIPEDTGTEQSLVFRTKNVTAAVSINGERVYETQLQDAPFYNKSPGTRWNVIRVPREAAGGVLRIDMVRAYTDGRCKVDNFYWGSEGRILIDIIKDKLFGILVSVLIMVAGVVYLLVYLLVNVKRREKDRSLLYLGMSAMVAGIWCILETNLLQLFTRHVQLLQLIDNMALAIGVALLFLYLDQLYHIFRKRILQILCGCELLYLALAAMFQIVGGPDFHETLYVAILGYGMICMLFVYCLIREGKHNWTKKSKKIDYRFKTLGVAFLGLGILGDLVRYLTADVMDRAMLVRLGFLAFILCFGIENVYHVFELIKQGYELEIVSKLAYVDGLTDVGNRTAYLEEKEELIRYDYPWEKLGIVAFDVNNLKYVNDTLGHHNGDMLLQAAANLIEESFREKGQVFRTGGDEFVVLLVGDRLEETYQSASGTLDRLIAEKNDSEEYEFELSIAYDVAWCSEVTAEGIMAAEEEADRKMYEKKLMMKKRRR